MTTFTMQDINPEPTTPEEEEAFKAIPNQINYPEDDEGDSRDDDEPRSFWNHRVVDLTSKNGGDAFFLIQEVYYDRQGKPCGYCDPCLGGDNLDEIRTQIQRFTDCLSQPILDADKDFDGNIMADENGVEII